MPSDCLAGLLGIQGYRVSAVERRAGGAGGGLVRVQLERTRVGFICDGCGQGVLQGYDHTWQELRHLMLWQHQTIVRFPRYRVNCPDCGIRTEALEFADVRGPRSTRAQALEYGARSRELVARGEKPPHRAVQLIHGAIARQAMANSARDTEQHAFEPVEILCRKG